MRGVGLGGRAAITEDGSRQRRQGNLALWRGMARGTQRKPSHPLHPRGAGAGLASAAEGLLLELGLRRGILMVLVVAVAVGVAVANIPVRVSPRASSPTIHSACYTAAHNRA